MLVQGCCGQGQQSGWRMQPDPEELSSKPALHLEMLLSPGDSLPPNIFSDSKVLPSRGRQPTCISSLKSEYAPEGISGTRATPWLCYIPGYPWLWSDHIMPQFTAHIPEPACGGAYKVAAGMETNVFWRKLSQVQEFCPVP